MEKRMTPSARWGVPKVVIADDDADIRALVSIAVQKAGLELSAEVDDGFSAWEAIQDIFPDLVILDVTMPGMTGLEIVRKIRSDSSFSGISILLLSAGVDDASRAAGMAAGADEYLTKPFSPRELAARLMFYADPLLGS
jgi:DNA-binding response OmpR family regulator